VAILRLLPGTNCRECGFATCLAFAAALSRGHTAVSRCPHLADPVEEKAIFPVCDAEGRLIRTVSLGLDTGRLRREIDRKEARIRNLESRLEAFENERGDKFEAANARLPTPLTRREVQVLRRIARGDTNKAISQALRISDHTVKSHVINIFNKIGVNDRVQASVWGAMNGII